MKSFTALVCACAALAASPAAATIWRVSGGGTLAAAPLPQGATQLQGVTLAGRQFTFSFELDDTVPASILNPSQSNFTGAISSFVANFDTIYHMTPVTPRNTLSVVVANDLSVSQTQRFDQFSHSASATVNNSGQLRRAHMTDVPLPQNGFISQFTFGRTQSGTPTSPPTMLSSTDFPDPSAIWILGTPTSPLTFVSLVVRAGRPGTVQDLAALPQAGFNIPNLSLNVVAVPEPASWALFIAGFGLVGSTLRRRRALHA